VKKSTVFMPVFALLVLATSGLKAASGLKADVAYAGSSTGEFGARDLNTHASSILLATVAVGLIVAEKAARAARK
jgi:hypothetical protein